MCFELFDAEFAKLHKKLTKNKAQKVAVDNLLFALVQEIGHAFVDALELPITGREEDAVDQFAALVLIEGDRASIASHAADGYLRVDTKSFDTNPAFRLRYSSPEQRFYSVLCLVCGANPDVHEDMVESETLPDQIAMTCDRYFS